ncbi:MAG: hypothetical protein AAGB00_08495 [Planctomycetota bacterium]
MPRPWTAIALLLVVATLASPASAKRRRSLLGRPVDAVEVFSCGFDDEKWDINYDRWPDRWTRHEGPGYPHYVEIGIDEDASTDSGRRLRVRLDGTQAIVASPPIRVMPKFSYSLELKVKIEQAPLSKVFVRLDYLTAEGEVKQAIRTDPIEATGDWVTVEVGPIRPRDPKVDRAIITIETERGAQGDLRGEVSIADLWIGRLPSLDVSANNPFHVYTDPRDVVINCSLSGIRERDPEIRFQLLDATSHEIGRQGATRLDGRPIVEQKQLIREETRLASDIVDGVGNHSVGFEGSTEWRPRIEEHGEYGFYQVKVEMLSRETGRVMYDRTITLAVIPPPPTAIGKARGEFGWTLPTADKPLAFPALEKVLPLVGVNWVKLPIWFPEATPERGEQVIQFAERLAASDIETVGIIQHPDLLKFEEPVIGAPPEGYTAANVFGGDASRWMPLYDHIMTRLSLRIRWWQLGGDHDTSFVGYEDLISQIWDIRHKLYRFGQDVGLGLGWRWDTPLLPAPRSWEFHQLTSNPPLQSAELESRLAGVDAETTRRWVLIEPVIDDPTLITEEARHVARVREFVKQIVAAKRHGADGIFVPSPFSGSHGLMTPSGKPGELLLPWRTCASLLGGAEYLGQLRLPSGSENWLFRRQNGMVVMVTWNDRQTEEALYLGDDVHIIDVWGKHTKPGRQGHRDVVPVGPMPRFVLGLHEAVARMRMSVHFEKDRVPSIFGQEHANALTLRNGFPQGVGGQLTMFVPDRLHTARGGVPRASEQWTIATPGKDFGVGPSSEYRMPIEIRLTDAAIGSQPIRIDFDLEADRADHRYRFSVWRSLEVGLGDVTIDVASKLDERERLVVRQTMTNTSGRPLSFKCYLHVRGRRRKRAQVFEAGPEPDIKTYTYANGRELTGDPALGIEPAEIRLRAEEIDGPRVLIQRFIAAP